MKFITRILSVVFLSSWLSVGLQAQEYNLDMRDTDIREFIASVGKLTGKTMVIDQRVTGTINIRSPESLSTNELYQVFLVQLDVSGFAVVDMGGNILKVIPKQAAKLEGVEVQGESSGLPDRSEAIITRVVKVRNVEVSKLVPILQPLVDNKTGIIAPYSAANVILITDRESNVRRLLEIVSRVDKADSDSMEVVKLRNASAKEMSRILTSLIRDQAKGQEGARNLPIITADERTNSLLVRGDQHSRNYLKTVIAELDNEIETPTNTKVIYLKYAKATVLATLLENVSESMIKSEQSKTADTPESKQLDVQIKAHEGTNAIVLSGNSLIIKSLESIIEKLDIRRAQVLVEAIIVEMSETRAKELGIQWLFRGDRDNSNVAVGGTNFSNLGNGLFDLVAGSEGGDPLTKTLSGVQGISVGVGRVSGSGFSFAAVLKALAGDSDSNVLSTPSLVTLDNEEASILVGQEVPVVTGSTASDDNSNPFQTIERKDIGIKLSVIPQINEGDSIQLQIQQEVSSLTGLSAADIITNKREIKTSVMIDDGATIVLGGLIDDDIQQSSQKVPGLGDIPGLGRAFRSDQSQRVRRNLMVFIRPTIIRDPETMANLSNSKYSYMRAQQLLLESKGIKLFPENSRQVILPEWTGMGPSSPNIVEF